MRVQLLPADQGGCAYYRIELPNYYLQCSFMDANLRAIRDEHGVIVDAVPANKDVDVVVLQRPSKQLVYECIPFLQKRGIAVVVEMDDDLENLPRANGYWEKVAPDRKWALKACQIADWVTVTTPALAKVYAKHGRFTVIPNYIDSTWFDIEPEKDPSTPWVGWTGNVATHPHDLEVIGTHFRGILDDMGAYGYVIGGSQAFPKLGLDGDMADFVDWLDLHEYPHEVGRLHVGIVPLHQSKFNDAKSWLKGAEYLAMGAFVVASPTPEYVALQKIMGTDAIRLAKRYRDWQKHLDHFIAISKDKRTSARLRKEMRGNAEQHLSIERNAWQYEKAWEQALKHRRQQTPKDPDWPLMVNPLFGRIVPDKDVDAERNRTLREKNKEYRGA